MNQQTHVVEIYNAKTHYWEPVFSGPEPESRRRFNALEKTESSNTSIRIRKLDAATKDSSDQFLIW